MGILIILLFLVVLLGGLCLFASRSALTCIATARLQQSLLLTDKAIAGLQVGLGQCSCGSMVSQSDFRH